MIRLLALALVFLPFWSAAQRAPFTYSDLLQIDRLSGLAVDPAGTTALFNVRATDMEKNKGVNSLWMKDLADPAKPEVKLPVSEGGASVAQWAVDGSGFFFMSAREGGVNQVWRADAAGTTATQLTRLPLDVEDYPVAPDGKGLVVAIAVFPDCPGNEIECTVKRLEANKAAKGSGTIHDKVFLRHWDTWKDGLRNHLFYIDLTNSTAPAIPLTARFDGDVPSKPFGGNEDFCISPDGRTVYFAARAAGKREPWSTSFDVYSVPVSGGEARSVTTENPAWDAMPVVCARWQDPGCPGKEINVTYLRNNKSTVVKARLKDNDGREGVFKKDILGNLNAMTVEDMLLSDLNALKIENGIRVKKIEAGKWKDAGLKEGFIISFLDRVPVDNVEDFNRMLEYKRGGILIEGYYEASEKKAYGLEW